MTRLLHTTTSLCRTCKNGVPARVVAEPDQTVWMEKTCEAHGPQRVRLSTNAAWYAETRAMGSVATPPKHTRPVEQGCPFDCGACTQHTQKTRLPVITLTSACNLDCPICYVFNKNAGAYHMSRDDFAATLDHLLEAHDGELDVLNLTGGDPSLHPEILEFLELAAEAGVHRVSLCTNGIRIVKEPGFVERLAAIGARVALSFDTFEPAIDKAMNGADTVALKLRCLDLLEQHGVDTTLIPVMSAGMNDAEIGRILDLGLSRPNIRHVEIHTITYTGQSGTSFDPSGRIGVWEVLQRIEQTTDGLLGPDDFVPSPCAHPLCYQIAYLLVDPGGGPPIPFTRFIDRQTLYACLGDRMYLEPSPRLERALLDAIDAVWTSDGDQRVADLLGTMLRELFPARPISRRESLAIGERWVKAVYLHSHMDEQTFDVERAAMCCDSNWMPDGTQIPICNYNVLYKETDSRFNARAVPWGEKKGGAFDLGDR